MKVKWMLTHDSNQQSLRDPRPPWISSHTRELPKKLCVLPFGLSPHLMFIHTPRGGAPIPLIRLDTDHLVNVLSSGRRGDEDDGGMSCVAAGGGMDILPQVQRNTPCFLQRPFFIYHSKMKMKNIVLDDCRLYNCLKLTQGIVNK